MSNSDGLPKGWLKAQLANLIQPRRDRVRPAEFEAHPFIGMEHVEPHTMRLIDTVPAGRMKSSSAFFQPNDVLYGRLRPYLNKVLRPEFEGLCSAEFIVFPDLPYLRSSFLQYRLNAYDFVSFASHLNEGDRPRVDFDQLGSFEVNLPPEPEQRRIVAKIEELFSDLDAGMAALERCKANLKRYRAAVLKAAVEGKLTEVWRAKNPPKETASQLLKRILIERRKKWEEAQLAAYAKSGKSPPNNWKDKYKQPVEPDTTDLPELPRTWVWASLDSLSCLIADIDHNMPKSVDKGVKFLSAKDLLDDGTLNFTRDVKLISEEDYARLSRKAQPKRNDIIYSRIGARLGKARLVETDERFLVSYSCCTIRPLVVNPVFLSQYLDSGFILTQAMSNTQSIGVPDLGLDRIKRFAVPLCSLDEQQENVSEVERRLSIAREGETQIEANLKRAARLRQSILKRAFEGKLVPQDPSDEPASILLGKIRTSRNNGNSKKPIKSSRKK